MSITERQFEVNGTEAEEIIVGKGIRFERIRRITGYLVGTLNRFNDAKRAEEKDRVAHVSMRQV